MLNESIQLDLVFQALADPIRRDILSRITGKDASVSELAKPHKISLPAISKHLKVLERANLIKRYRLGRESIVSLNPASLDDAAKQIEFYTSFWNEQLENLRNYLEE